MADRVKYFLLGVLFLVVAGVIAYDKWNSAGDQRQVADRGTGDTTGKWDVYVPPRVVDPPLKVPDTEKPQEDPGPAKPEPKNDGGAKEGERIDHGAPPAPEEKKPVEPPPEPKTHVIRKGETLEAIAMEYYGTREGITWIVQANKLSNPNKIFVNQKLILPAMKETVKEPAKAKGREKEAAGEGKPASGSKPAAVPTRYRVKQGDGDLYAICRRIYGREGNSARVSRVMEMNHLYSADVKVGTLLILPAR
jgi:nucleoid-associated protein YgaU